MAAKVIKRRTGRVSNELEPQGQVETDDTPYDMGYDPFEYHCFADYRDSVNRLVDALNKAKDE